MSTLQDVEQLLVQQENPDDCCRECYEALSKHTLTEILPGGGHTSVYDALRIFRVRHWTTQQAGTPTCGFEETLRNLSTRPPDELISMHVLGASDRVFTVFVSGATSSELIGCIRVMLGAPSYDAYLRVLRD